MTVQQGGSSEGGGSPQDPKVDAQEWAQTVSRLMKNMEAHHAGITTARKREGLTRALVVREPDGAALRKKLNRLVDSWSMIGGADPIDTTILPAAGTATVIGATSATLTTPLASSLASVASSDSRTAPAPSAAVTDRLRDLLCVLLRSIAELTPEHALLAQQVEQINQTLALPLTERRVFEAERQLRALMIKQGAIRHSLEEAKNAIKEMVTTLIARLSAVSDSAGGYYDKVEAYSIHIRKAENIAELSDIIRGLLDDTRVVSLDMARARDDLVYAKQKVREHEQRVHALEEELAKVSQLVRTDPLTETLNRRGFEEAYSAEIARVMRQGDVLTVAMLDLDDFKRLNDVHGHQAGDMALRYLADVMRDTLRPTDAIGRYGGEEFAILLPGVGVDDAAIVMTRIQRELTRRIFLHDNEKILITFSAGVAAIDPTRGLAEAMERCDRAMYAAKQSGKNRVNIAPAAAAAAAG